MAVSNKLIVAIVAIVVVVAMLLIIVVPYNSLVSKDQDVKNKWSNIKVEVKRQMDLIPQILNQQNISMYFEQSLLANITALRTQWLNTIANASVNEQVNFSQAFSVQFGSLLSIAESNPTIQSIETIRDVTIELEGTQNRITAAQTFYNDAVNAYNTEVRSFPSNVAAGMFGFTQASYYLQEQ